MLLIPKVDEIDVCVFDLDYTCWPFFISTEVELPLKQLTDGSVVDQAGKVLQPYPDVKRIFEALLQAGYRIAVASR